MVGFPFGQQTPAFPLGEDDKRMALIQGLLAGGGALMQAGGPSTSPVSAGQAFGSGINSAMGAFQGAQKQALARQQAQQQQQYMAAQTGVLTAQAAAQQRKNEALARFGNPPPMPLAAPGTQVASNGPVGVPQGQPQTPQFPLGMSMADMAALDEDFPSKWALQNARTAEWEPIKDEKGRVIGQRNTKTNEEKYLPGNMTDEWVQETRSGIPGQVNSRTGEFKALDPTLSRVTMNPIINQPFESGFEKELGTELAKQAAGVHAGAETARGNLARLDQLDGLLKGAETGKLAPAYATMGAWADALGIDDSMLAKMKMSRESVANAQSIGAVTNALTVGMIGPGGFPANNFSDADRKFLQQTMPQLSNMPNANQVISQAMRKAAERSVMKEEAWLDARKSGKSYSDFLKDWNQYVKTNSLFPKVTSPEQMGSLPSGSVFTAPDGSIRVKP